MTDANAKSLGRMPPNFEPDRRSWLARKLRPRKTPVWVRVLALGIDAAGKRGALR